MLGGRISNHDEEEVEDELAALQAELAEEPTLPSIPNNQLPIPERRTETQQPVRERQPEEEGMLAA